MEWSSWLLIAASRHLAQGLQDTGSQAELTGFFFVFEIQDGCRNITTKRTTMCYFNTSLEMDIYMCVYVCISVCACVCFYKCPHKSVLNYMHLYFKV